ncbi:MAG: mechanosensitive ion channel family protein [Bacteroidia bacterium]|nr:mechanosensitive ion channel family protein [Bacteroidia bacterium]
MERVREIGLTLVALLVIYLFYRLTNWLYRYILKRIYNARKQLFRGFNYNNYPVLSPGQQLSVVLFVVKSLRLLTHLLMLYLALPVIFSIFPATRGIADQLLEYVLNPLKAIGVSIINYIPNLFVILIIYLCTRYTIRLVKFIAQEIESGKLVIHGFYPDWARPTYNIIRVIAYAFMFVMIFPYLPNSDSQVFQGVTVFIGILFSLGSSSAISNMVAGIVLTYMRPFKLGDRVQIGDLVGDVMERNLLITRIRTIKNEEITIPNSSILNGHTINFTSSSQLILHSTVTIGYDVPWRQVHELLIRAAQMTEGALAEPKPFVLQTSLDDFYVSYQINLYSNYAQSIPETYSDLHQHIQDLFNEAGVEILSPHYRAARDGNQVTIPDNYLPPNYEAPAFKVKVDRKEDKK